VAFLPFRFKARLFEREMYVWEALGALEIFGEAIRYDASRAFRARHRGSQTEVTEVVSEPAARRKGAWICRKKGRSFWVRVAVSAERCRTDGAAATRRERDRWGRLRIRPR